MPDLTVDCTLAEFVTAKSGAASVLESFGLDYCCGGRQPLHEACATIGIDPAAVLKAVAGLEYAPTADWTSMAPAELVDHVEAVHHSYLHTELVRLEALVDKVAVVHGERH